MDIFNIWKLAAAMSVLAAPGLAEQQFSCAGVDPDWVLEIFGDTARFPYIDAAMLDIPHQTVAKNRDWPVALTLLGGRNTAIVILNERACSTSEVTGYPIEANILTQKAETPVILTGCCTTR